MPKSTPFSTILAELTQQARLRGWNDSAWASRAGLRKETLSRLRRRSTCDFETLEALADAAGVRLGVMDPQAAGSAPDAHFVEDVDRDYEERLVQLCASRVLDPQQWANCGPRFFMAGVAVMLASVQGFDRRGLLALAERLHPGASEPEVFARWLTASPLRPARFLPLVTAGDRHAA